MWNRRVAAIVMSCSVAFTLCTAVPSTGAAPAASAAGPGIHAVTGIRTVPLRARVNGGVSAEDNVVLSHHGRTIAVCLGNDLSLVDVASAAESKVGSCRTRGEPIGPVQFSADDRYLLIEGQSEPNRCCSVVDRDPDGDGTLDDSTPTVTTFPTSANTRPLAISGDGRFIFGEEARSFAPDGSVVPGRLVFVDRDPQNLGQRNGVAGSRVSTMTETTGCDGDSCFEWDDDVTTPAISADGHHVVGCFYFSGDVVDRLVSIDLNLDAGGRLLTPPATESLTTLPDTALNCQSAEPKLDATGRTLVWPDGDGLQQFVRPTGTAPWTYGTHTNLPIDGARVLSTDASIVASYDQVYDVAADHASNFPASATSPLAISDDGSKILVAEARDIAVPKQSALYVADYRTVDVARGAKNVALSLDKAALHPGLDQVSIQPLQAADLQQLRFANSPSGRRANLGDPGSADASSVWAAPSGRRAPGAESDGTSALRASNIAHLELGAVAGSWLAGSLYFSGDRLGDIGLGRSAGWQDVLAGTPLAGLGGTATWSDLMNLLRGSAVGPDHPLRHVELGELLGTPSLDIFTIQLGNPLTAGLFVANGTPTGGSWCQVAALFDTTIDPTRCADATKGEDLTFERSVFSLDPSAKDISVALSADALRNGGSPAMEARLASLSLGVSRIGTTLLAAPQQEGNGGGNLLAYPNSPLRGVTVGQLRDHLSSEGFSNVLDCSGTGSAICADRTATLGHAFDAHVVRETATLDMLGTQFNGTAIGDIAQNLPRDVVINDVIVAALDRADWPWEELDAATAPLQEHSVAPKNLEQRCVNGKYSSCRSAHAKVSFTVFGTRGPTDAWVRVETPVGFRYRPDRPASVDGRTVSITPVQDRTDARTVEVWHVPALAEGAHTLQFDEWAGTRLGQYQTTASVEVAEIVSPTVTAPINVNAPVAADTPDTPTADTWLESNTLTFSYISAPEDVDVFRVRHPENEEDAVAAVRLATPAIDGDLVTYGPPRSASAVANQKAPTSVPLADEGGTTNATSREAPAEQANDVPIADGQQVTASSLTANSGIEGTNTDNADYVQVSAYNGQTSNDPYVLRSRFDPPAASTRCTVRRPHGGRIGPKPDLSRLPADLETLILINTKRLGDRFGPVRADALLHRAQALAASPLTHGAVLSVDALPAIDAIPSVRDAYDAWDANPCDPDGANGVVKVLTQLVSAVARGDNATIMAHPNLRYVVIVGDDDIVPMARVTDTTRLGNEREYAASLSEGAIRGALEHGDLLTDDAYGDLDPVTWLDHSLFVPELAVGRLVQSPAAIERSISRFLTSGGRLDPEHAVVAGYDFMTDGAKTVAADLTTALTAAHGAPVTPRLLEDPAYSSADLLQALSTGNDATALYGHADNTQLRAANGDLIDARTLGGALQGADLVFSMGCHLGLEVPGSGTKGLPRDVASEVGRNGGVFVATSGFGYGDRFTVGMNEELLHGFATRLNGEFTVGVALAVAKQEYWSRAGLYGPYDEKVLEATQLYGLPMYRVGAKPTTPSPIQPVAATKTGTEHHAESFDLTIHTTTTPEFPDLGNVQQVQGPHGQMQPPQVTPNRPFLPRTERDLNPIGQGTKPKPAHGVLITGLHTGTDTTGFDPVVAAASVQTAGPALEHAFGSAALPSRFARINTYTDVATRTDAVRQRLVLVPAQYRSDDGTGTGLGRMRSYDKVGTDVYYSTSTDYDAPVIRRVTSTAGPTSVEIRTRITDTQGVTRVLGLADTGASTWTTLEFTRQSGGWWSATIPIPQPRHDIELIVQAVDRVGNVAISNDKGANYVIALTAKVATATPFGVDSAGEWAVDQSFHTVRAAPDMTWTFAASWADGAPAMAVQVEGDGARPDGTHGPLARLIVPGAVMGTGGCGTVCTVPVAHGEGATSRIRLWRLNSDARSQHWGVWLIDDAGNETPIGNAAVDPKRVLLGAINVQAQYHGPAADCSSVPPSTFDAGPFTAKTDGFDFTLSPDTLQTTSSGCGARTAAGPVPGSVRISVPASG